MAPTSRGGPDAASTALPVATPWFHRQDVGDGITLVTEPHVDPLLRANLFVVRGRDRDLLVDGGTGVAPLVPALEGLLDPARTVAVATHAHVDHVGALHEVPQRLAHPAEAADLERGPTFGGILARDWSPALRDALAALGLPVPPVLLTARPDAAFDPAAHRYRPAPATGTIDEGDVVDLGDRAFRVLHVPGHSPGSIALLDERRGILLSGDAVYDGTLLDGVPGADPAAYRETVARLRDLPVRVVHAGHEGSFGRGRLVEICDAYARRG